MNLDLNVGDIVLGGKFKNKPIEIGSFGTDENNQPTIVTKKGKAVKLLAVRIKKLMPPKKASVRIATEILAQIDMANQAPNILDKNLRDLLDSCGKYRPKASPNTMILNNFFSEHGHEIVNDEEMKRIVYEIDDIKKKMGVELKTIVNDMRKCFSKYGIDPFSKY